MRFHSVVDLVNRPPPVTPRLAPLFSLTEANGLWEGGRIESVHECRNGHEFPSFRVRRRLRPWPEALKREIVAASLVAGASVLVVARRYDFNTNQVFGWWKLLTPDRADTAPPPPAADIIKIALASGHRVRVGGGVKAASLRLVLDALERR